MNVVGHLYPGAARFEKYQVNATVSNVGIPMLAGATTEAGLDLPTTVNALDMVGVNWDTATYVTAQQTDGTSAERTVTVDSRPDAIIECRLSGGATTGTALTKHPVITASADGLSVVVTSSFASPELLYGVVWGYDGANAGQFRKITATSGGDATVTVAFDNDIAVGDNFLRANTWPAALETFSVELTADFLEADSTVAVASTGAEFQVISMTLGDNGETDGTLSSSVLMVSGDHVLGGRLT